MISVRAMTAKSTEKPGATQAHPLAHVDLKSARKSTGRLLEAGFLLGVLKIAANVLKPVIVSFLKKKVSAFASGSRHSGK